jgi:hypothetical protein
MSRGTLPNNPPLDVSPFDVYVASQTFAQGAQEVENALNALSTALSSSGAMAGDDAPGQQFASSYDPAAASFNSLVQNLLPTLSGMAQALVTTANNWLKAESHNTAGKQDPDPGFPLPGLILADTVPNPPSAQSSDGGGGLPGVLAKFWPDGHQDKLRAAATAWRQAGTSLNGVGTQLRSAMASITDDTRAGSVQAMQAFFGQVWSDDGDGSSAPLSHAVGACGQIAGACDDYASEIDSARSSTERAMAVAGIATGLTTALGVVASVFSFGLSDAGAGAADAAEAEGILGPIFRRFATAVKTVLGSYELPELGAALDALAEAVPDITTVEAETTPVISPILDAEMEQAESDFTQAGSTSSAAGQPPNVPQGLSSQQFQRLSDLLKQRLGNINGQIVVQGSRASYTAGPNSDIDIAIRVDQKTFGEFWDKKFADANPGSAKEATGKWAIQTGKIQAGEAGLRGLRRQLQQELDMDVDLSIITVGGPFDNPPFIEIE